MKVKGKEKTKIGAKLLAATIANPNWIGSDGERVAYAWHLTQAYCTLVESESRPHKHPSQALPDD